MHLPRLHVITNTTVQSNFSHFQLAEMAFAAGHVAVQYRNKSFDPGRDLAELQAISDLSRRLGKCLIINDDAQLAFQVGAQGVHLGKEDGSVAEARALLGSEAIIGATVHDMAELEAVKGMAIDYVGIGPVYGTGSKDVGLPDLGLEGLKRLCAAASVPVIAIGGIRVKNVGELKEAGAYGVAVISAFCKAEVSTEVAKAFLEGINR